MNATLECYTTRLPKMVKQSIKVLAAQQGCTQQELITKLITRECQKKKGVSDMRVGIEEDEL